MTKHVTFPKPLRGEYRLECTGKKRSRKLAEDKTMAQAKRRDGNKCRWPRCVYKELVIECAHLDHRKMGGNPAGDKTQRHKLIALCVRHHDQFDGRALPDIAIEPVNAKDGTDGPCAYYVRGESGRMEHVATEKYIGVSEARR
jgi:hypothetical protein